MFEKRRVFMYCILFALLIPIVGVRAEEGILGGEFAAVVGAQVGPFKTGAGPYVGGEVGLPLMMVGSGRLMGLIHIGAAKTDDDVTFEPMVNVLSPGALPVQKNIDLTTLSILIGLKYKVVYHHIVQPYVFAGPGFFVFLNESEPGELVGGIAPQPGTLKKQGFPSGQGDVLIGFHTGGGMDFNVTRKIFVGAEGRYNWVNNNNGSFGMFGGRVGFRF
ncbi:MAG: outer membrane beta-barrel protein [Candidatus Caldarchaeum sp.]